MRVMRVLTRCNLGGPAQQAIALWHAHAALGVRTLLVTGAVGRGETELSPAAHGVPALDLGAALAAGDAAAGWVVVPELGNGIAPLRDARAGRRLARLLAVFRPHVVHTHTSKAGWLGRTAARRHGAPTVHTFHGHVLEDYFAAPLQWWLRRLERRLAASTDQLVAVSASCADELAAAGIAPRPRFTVVPPAVPVVTPWSRAQARQHLGIAADERRIACVGRLVPIKRVEHFLQVVADLPGVHGDVVGDGPLREQLERAAPANRVRFRGALPGIAAMLAAYDALVLPSVREGHPLVAVEARRAGVPVVGYDVPGVRDALAEANAGTPVPPAAGPRGLAAAVQRWLDAPRAPRPDPGIDRCDPATVARALLGIYRGVCERRGLLP